MTFESDRAMVIAQAQNHIDGELTREIKALRADLKALAVAGERVTKGAVMYAAGDGDTLFNVGLYDLKRALARPGVQEVLDQATSRACSGKS